MNNKRQDFVKTFFRTFGAKEIQWKSQNENFIKGTIIYDSKDPEERQDFVWYINEEDVPSYEAMNILKYLIDNDLINGDKLKCTISDINIPEFDKEMKTKAMDELYRVSVNMIDDGQKTDYFFIHD